MTVLTACQARSLAAARISRTCRWSASRRRSAAFRSVALERPAGGLAGGFLGGLRFFAMPPV